MAAAVGISSMEKLQASEAWSRIRADFYVTGNAAAVQRELTEVIDQMSIELFDEAFTTAVGAGGGWTICMTPRHAVTRRRRGLALCCAATRR